MKKLITLILIAFTLSVNAQVYKTVTMALDTPTNVAKLRAGTQTYNLTDTFKNYVSKIKRDTISGVKVFTADTTFAKRLLIGADKLIGTENVALKVDITNDDIGAPKVGRAAQFYITQESPQSFTTVDALAINNTPSDIDHFYNYQAFARVIGSHKTDRVANYFGAITHDGTDSISIAANFYALPINDPLNLIKKKWSFFAASDPAYIGGGIGMNTYSPQEFVDYDINIAGRGFKIANSYVGNWQSSPTFASFTNYAVKSDGTSAAILQDNTGETYINSATGKELNFTIGTASKGTLLSSGNWQFDNTGGSTDNGNKVQITGNANVDGNFNTSGLDNYDTDLSGGYVLESKVSKRYVDGNFSEITGGTGYIQNQNSVNQTANFKINGNGFLAGNLTANSYTGDANLTGTPTAPTPTAGDNSTKIATTAYVDQSVSSDEYTPTLTAVTNISSLSNITSSYIKIGDFITVTGSLTATVSGIVGLADFYITIPIETGDNSTLTGQGVSRLGGVLLPASIEDTSPDLALVSFQPTGTGVHTVRYSFTYKYTSP